MTKSRFKTLDGFAIGMLLDAHAITECDHHGYMRDRSDPHAFQRAKEAAAKTPFKTATKEARLKAIDDVLSAIGDTCPECR